MHETLGEDMTKKKCIIGLVLTVILIVMGMTPHQAQSARESQYKAVTNTNTASSTTVKWFFETVDSSPTYDIGEYVSIALDHTNGTPYISYYEASHQMLQMAKYVGAGGNCGTDNHWACETVDHTGNVGKYSSIAIDPADDFPKIAYYDDTENALKLATYNAFGWDIQTISDPLIDDVGRYTSLAVNPTVKAGIAYYLSNFLGDDSLWYAKYVDGGTGNCGGGDFQCDPVDSGEGRGKFASLALDSANRPHIAYYDGGNDALKYASYDGTWRQRWILGAPSGQYASLAIDVNNGDRPHIAHYDAVNGTLEYATYVGSNGNCGINVYNIYEWQCDEIDSMGTGTHARGISLALDQAGHPVIVYQTGTSVLKIARPAVTSGQIIGNCGPATPFFTWQCDLIRIGFGIGQGDYLSLALSSAGLPMIAYYGNISDSMGDLNFAFQQFQIFLPLGLSD
jgi:hypothetical protein